MTHDDPRRFWRGLWWGLCLSLLLWAVLIGVVRALRW